MNHKTTPAQRVAAELARHEARLNVPAVCKFCDTGNPRFNSHRDGITFDCGAQCMWHEPPHGEGWSWWTQPASCKIIAQRPDASPLWGHLKDVVDAPGIVSEPGWLQSARKAVDEHARKIKR